MANKNKKSTEILNKLKGLESYQKRIHFVQVGKDYDNKKIYFKTSQEAIDMYHIMSGTNPVQMKQDSIYTSEYPNLEDELDRSDADLSFNHLVDNLDIMVGSEVKNMFDSKEEAGKAKVKKEAELKKRDRAALKIKNKK